MTSNQFIFCNQFFMFYFFFFENYTIILLVYDTVLRRGTLICIYLLTINKEKIDNQSIIKKMKYYFHFLVKSTRIIITTSKKLGSFHLIIFSY